MRKISTKMLKNTAEIWGIKVVYENLHQDLYGKANAGTKTITLNISLKNNPIQERCVLVHEIGHILYPPRPGYERYYSRDFFKYNSEECSSIKKIVAQDERKVNDWAMSILIPDDIFNRIIADSDYSISDLMEMFEVEKWAVEHKLGYYRRKEHNNRRKGKWRDIIAVSKCQFCCKAIAPDLARFCPGCGKEIPKPEAKPQEPDSLYGYGPVLTIKQVAEILMIGQNRAYEYAQQGLFPAARIGARWRISTKKFFKWIEDSSQAAASGGR